MSVIMETANTATLHATRSKRVLSEFSCTSNVQDIDNLSREAQGELLFDSWEDVGEESLSDDSLCLRLSEDDESDPDDTRAPGLICNQHTNSKSDTTENESARQKRKTAKDAEDIIRNKFLNSDINLDSNDGSEMVVTVNDQANVEKRTTSITTSTTTAATTTITSTTIATGATTIASPPHTLKRKFIDTDLVDDDGNAKTKTMKASFESEKDFGNAESSRNNKEAYEELAFVRNFFQRDAKQKLVKLKQEELEGLLIQKIIEAIAMRGEIGRLHEQARILEKNQEATRIKCQQLAKKIKDFEIVLNHIALNRRANDEPVQSIKITRSVGVQVNSLTDHGVQSLQQLQQQNTAQESSSVLNSTNPNFYESSGNTTNPRREIIVRVPRIPEASTPIATKVPTTATQVPSHPQISTATPAPLVVAKPLETSHALALPAECSNRQPTLPKPTQQSIILNGKLPIQANRQPVQTLNTRKSSINDLINLTDGGTEKTKSAVGPSIETTTTFVPTQGTATSKTQTLQFQRLIQTLPGNMSLATQPTSIRVVKSSSPSTPTTLEIQPISYPGKSQYSAVNYKTGMPTIANGTVGVLTIPANSRLQLIEHPAPLPETSIYPINPTWKLPPPAPLLKISKAASGIALYWNMTLEDKHADIASFQLYAYQEVAGVPPSTNLWKKVGDIRAMPLPMACTLSWNSEGKNYHFAVRGVDIHSRLGQYSPPGSISL